MQGMQNDRGRDAPGAEILYTPSEVCTLCRITVTTLSSYIEHGLIDEISGAESRFQQVHVIRILKANRLQRELELDIAHLALVIDLLDTIETQQRELDVLRKLLV